MVMPSSVLFRTYLMKGLVPLFLFLGVVFFIPIQTLLLEGIKIGGVKPDLGLTLTCVISLARGYKQGLLAGLLFGGLQDLFSMGVLGTHTFLNGLTGLSIGLLERFFVYFSLKAHIFIILLISLIHRLIGQIVSRGLWEGLKAVSFIMAGQAFYNCLLILVILLALLKFHPLTKEGNKVLS